MEQAVKSRCGVCVYEKCLIYTFSLLPTYTNTPRPHFHSILGQTLPKSLSTLHLSLRVRRWQITAENPPSPNLLGFFSFFKPFSTILLHSSFSKEKLQAELQVLVLLRTEHVTPHTIVNLAGSARASPLINL